MGSLNFLNIEYLFNSLLNLVSHFSLRILLYFIIDLITILRPIAIIVGIIFLAGIIYCIRGMRKIQRDEAKARKALMPADTIGGDIVLNSKWQRVQNHINSANPSDWKLAILEADIMLGEILDKAGYKGDTIGEQLKQVERSDFLTLDQAWEAHRVRNMIAHEGSEFEINDREARRVISLFEQVFREFYYI